MRNPSSRTTLIIGAAVVAGGMIATVADVQAQAPAAPAAPGAAAATPATPRDADGHPVLSGMWTGGASGVTATTAGNVTQVWKGRGGTFVGLEADGGLRREANDNLPLYKPEFWDRITENEYQGNWDDPVSSCIPLGVPRLGVPAQIVKVEGQPAYVLFNKAGFTGYAGSYNSWDVSRWIWADGRPHNVNYAASETLMGDATAKWEGDTLVIESTGFSDESWLHKNGWPHGFKMKVTERLTRIGNDLIWEATVEDPEYLQQPWKMTPIVARLNTNANAILGESPPCIVREPYASHVRSG
jgi:hypothetical protein